MGQAYMSKFDWLTFARRKEMIELQDVAIKALPESSVHGISNIAWALSTISGSAIYFGEMDLMAKTASDSVEEFKPQNLANRLMPLFINLCSICPLLFFLYVSTGKSGAHRFSAPRACPVFLGICKYESSSSR
jgi:hypothetical protein